MCQRLVEYGKETKYVKSKIKLVYTCIPKYNWLIVKHVTSLVLVFLATKAKRKTESLER